MDVNEHEKRVIFAGVKFVDFESKRYTKNFGVFKFDGC
jgi:hypothetical protein